MTRFARYFLNRAYLIIMLVRLQTWKVQILLRAYISLIEYFQVVLVELLFTCFQLVALLIVSCSLWLVISDARRVLFLFFWRCGEFEPKKSGITDNTREVPLKGARWALKRKRAQISTFPGVAIHAFFPRWVYIIWLVVVCAGGLVTVTLFHNCMPKVLANDDDNIISKKSRWKIEICIVRF